MVVCELIDATFLAELYNISEAAVFIWKNDSGAILNLRPFISSIIYSCPCSSSKGNELKPALKTISNEIYIFYFLLININFLQS